MEDPLATRAPCDRLAALHRYNVLDTPPEEAFDRITELAAQWLDVPIALITLLDEERQWFKSRIGLDRRETPREDAFCAYNLDGEGVLVVEDATQDSRFAENPLVTGDPGICFYAGAPLITPNGHFIGSLCVIDTKPRPISDKEADALRKLAAMVVDELELRAARNSRTNILESITDAFYALNADWRFTYVNAEAETLLERPREELLGKNIWEQFPETKDLPNYDAYHRAVKTGQPVQFQAYSSLFEAWFDVKAYPKDDGGLAVYFKDITAQKEREDELRETRALLDSVVTNAGVGICVTDPEGRFVRVNEAYTELYGWSKEELLGEPFTMVVPPEDRAIAQDAHDRFIFDEVDETTGEWTVQRKDGSLRIVLATAGRFEGTNGMPHKVTTVLDITERKHTEEKLQAREEYLSVMLDSIGDAVIATDPNGRITEMNPVAEALTKWPRTKAKGLHLDDILQIHSSKTREVVESPVTKVLREGGIVGMADHTVLTARDGTERQIADSAAPIRDHDGTLLGIVLVFRDETEQHERRRMLDIERERFQMALRGGDLGLWDWNMNTDEVTYNARWAEMLGYTLDEIEDTEAFFAEHTHPEDLERVRQANERHARGEIPHIDLEIRMRAKDGSQRWMLDRGKILEWNEDGTPRRMVGTHLDITQRKAREEAVRESQFLLRTSQRIAHLGHWDWDVSEDTITWSDETYRIFGYAPGSIEVTRETYLEHIPPEDRARISVLNQKSITTGEMPTAQHRIIRADGEERVVEISGVTMGTNADGQPNRVIGTVQDVTNREETEQALRRQRDLLQQTQRLAGAWEYDPQTGDIELSSQARRVLEWPADEPARFGNMDVLFPPDAREELYASIQQAVSEGASYDLELPLATETGPQRWMRTVGRGVKNEAGEVIKLAGAIQDITARKQAEHRLRIQLGTLERVAKGAPLNEVLAELITAIEAHRPGMKGSVLLCDAAEGRIRHGVAPNLPDAYNAAIDGVAIGPAAGSCGTAMHEGTPIIAEDIASDPRWADYRDIALEHGLRACWSVPIFNSDGDVIGSFALYHERPTAPTEADHKLIDQARSVAGIAIERHRASEQMRLLDAAVQNAADSILITEAAFNEPGPKIVYVNESFEEVTGYSRDEIIGQTPRILQGPETKRAPLDRMREAFEQWEPVRETVLNYTKDGEPFWNEIYIAPVKRDDGMYTHWVSVQRDFTEEREMRRTLAENKERFQALAEETSDVISRVDEQGTFLYLSPAIESLLGYRPEALIGRPFHPYIHPEDRPTIQSRLQDAFEGERVQVEHRIKHDAGHYIWVESAARLTGRRSGAPSVVVSTRPIGRRKRAEQELQRERNLLQRIFDASPAAILVFDLDGAIVLANEQAQAVLGHPLETITGSLFNDGQWSITDLDGNPIPDETLPFAQVLGEKRSIRNFRHAIRTSAGERRILSVNGAPLFVESENVNGAAQKEGLQDETLLGAVFVVEDITEQRRRKLDLIEARDAAEEASRLKSALMANMSHEVRTPLTSVIGFAEALDDMDLTPPADQFAKMVHRGGQRLLSTLNAVLDLSQLEAGAMPLYPEEVNVSTLVREVATGFQLRAQEAQVGLRIDVPKPGVTAFLDRSAMERIMANLMSNAIKFTGEGAAPGGEVDVSLEATSSRLILSVADTGVGIDEAFLPRLFEAFKQESTGDSRSFEGSGLGLAITKELVELMEGDIDVESVKGEGTTFTVTLPRGEDASSWRGNEEGAPAY